jgi:hypothetical protein
MSRIKQASDSNESLARNSSADRNVRVAKPEAFSSRSKARLKLASSSTIAIVCVLGDISDGLLA